MKYLQKTITSGYLLITLLIGCIAYTWHHEWQEVEALEVSNQQIDEFRKEVNHIHIRLIEFSLMGETVLDWDETDLENYHTQRIALDSILNLFNETYAIGHIDSVRPPAHGHEPYSHHYEAYRSAVLRDKSLIEPVRPHSIP